MWIGVLLLLLGALAMFIVDLSGHTKYYSLNHQAAACIFTQNDTNHSFHLGLPWAVNVLPAVLMEVAVALLVTTAYEFISAQSPHSMKGFLIGVFYAVRGTFKFLGTVSMLPFSMSAIWTSDYMKTHLPPVTNCGFGYLLLTCTIGFFSLVLFTVAVRRYKYRERDDPPYNQIVVESVWASDGSLD